MNVQANAAASLQAFDDDAWDDLLNYIEERRVIPIVGPDLLRVQTDSGLRPLYDWLAEKLAAKLSVDPVGLPRPLTLNDVVCSYLGQRGRREHQCANNEREGADFGSAVPACGHVFLPREGTGVPTGGE